MRRAATTSPECSGPSTSPRTVRAFTTTTGAATGATRDPTAAWASATTRRNSPGTGPRSGRPCSCSRDDWDLAPHGLEQVVQVERLAYETVQLEISALLGRVERGHEADDRRVQTGPCSVLANELPAVHDRHAEIQNEHR